MTPQPAPPRSSEVETWRKKPVQIQAMRCTPDTADAVAAWCGGRVIRETKPSDPTDVSVVVKIPTLEGVMTAQTYHGGDYVIRGVQGEFYPCKPDIFLATYEPAADDQDRLCSSCGQSYDTPPCSRNPATGESSHTVYGGVGQGATS